MKEESCYHSTQKAVISVLDWMMCKGKLERKKLCTEKDFYSVEEEQQSRNTLVVDQENNTGVFVTKIKAIVISTVSLQLHSPYWSF